VTIFPQIGLSVAALAFVTLGASITAAPTPIVLALTMCVGIGLGMVMPPTQVTVQLAAGREALGVATASIALSRSLGGALGVAIVGAVLFALIGTVDGTLARVLREVVEGGPAYITQLSPQQRGALAAHLDGAYRVVFFVLAAIAAAGALIARTIPTLRWSARR
jgi:MFS family permease